MPASEAAGDKRVQPVVEGWFSLEDPPHLLGRRCRACGSVCFPPTAPGCPNPACGGTDLEEARLSRVGRIWSLTEARYPPPPPYPAPEPFRPFGLAAVELGEERMVVLGQLVAGADVEALRVGDPVELVLDPLWEDADTRYLTWKWRPLPADGGDR